MEAAVPEHTRGFLETAGRVLAATLDYETTLAEVARLAVPEVADWCAVDISEADGKVRQLTSRHPDPELEAFLLELRRRFRVRSHGGEGALAVIASGQPELVERAEPVPELLRTDAERALYARLGPRSYLIVPLDVRGGRIGALTLLTCRDELRYGAEDLEWAGLLAERCALAVDNARLYTEAEQRFAVLDAVFATAPVGLGLLDADLRFVRVNERLAALNRLPVAEHIGRTPDLAGPAGVRRRRLYERVLATGRPVVEHEMEGPGGAWWLVSGTPIAGSAHPGGGAAVGVLETVVDITERRRSLERAGLLARAGDVLESSLDFDTTLRNVARVAVPAFCDWCAVHLLEDSDAGHPELPLVAVAHADPAREATARALAARFPVDPDDATGVAAVVRTGVPEVTRDVTDEQLRAGARGPEHLEFLQNLGMRGVVMAPLRARGRTFGAISFATAGSGRSFSAADVEVAVDLGRRAAMAVDNARLYTARADIAHTLQSRLLPTRLPHIPGVGLAARYRAAGEFNEVGGDFYDVMSCPSGDWIVVVGDVTGKGAEAAAVTALARYTLRAASLQTESPSEMLGLLNAAMRTQDEGGTLCTAAVARLRPGEGPLGVTLALGGHEPALVLRADGRVEEAGRYGSLLGLLDDPRLHDTALELGPGETLLLYTDGMTDAGAPAGAIGEDGLSELLATLGAGAPDALLLGLEHAAVAAQEGEPRDDIALMAIRPHSGMGSGDPGSPETQMTFTEVEVAGGPHAPAHARQALQERLEGTVPAPVAQDAGLLVSELVTNSVLHGGGMEGGDRVGVRIGLTEKRIRIEVCDPGPGFDPADPGHDPDEPGGYGLFLVTQLAEAWGVDVADKTRVWFELRR